MIIWTHLPFTAVGPGDPMLNKALIVSLLASTITACGGGGSSSGDETPSGNQDTIAPVITLTGESTITLSLGASYTEQGATAIDDVDGTINVNYSGDVDIKFPGSYTITYTATDAAGNIATITRIITILDAVANTGVLTDLVGVNYETATQSGVIAANGEFQYLADETLTLSIGNTLLGQVPAAANVSINSLFTGLPETAKAIRTALRMPEYTSTRIRTDIYPSMTQGRYNALHKASNLMQLLLALDNNHDASDGINITDNTAATSNLDISFDTNLFEFSDSTSLKAFQHTSNISLGMEVSKPLSEVYKLMDITLSVPRRTTKEGTNDRDQTYLYNTLGQLTQQEGQQTSDSLSRYAFTYDDTSGLMLSDEFTTNPVDDSGYEPYREKIIYTYNNFGLEASNTSEKYVRGSTDVVESRKLYTNIYVDDKVFKKNARQQNDINADGTYTSSQSVRTEYNDLWKLTSDKTYVGATPEEEEFDYGGTYSYTADGMITASDDENTNSNSSEQTTYSQKETAEGLERSLNSVSSRVGHDDTKEIITEYFNSNGQLVSKKTTELDKDDNITGESNIVYGYDADGRVNSCQFDQGTQSTSKTSQTLTYGDAGLESILTSTDSDGDGTSDSEETISMSYGENGEILTDTDGQTFLYGEPVTNAIGYLLNEHSIDKGYVESPRAMEMFFNVTSHKCNP